MKLRVQGAQPAARTPSLMLSPGHDIGSGDRAWCRADATRRNDTRWLERLSQLPETRKLLLDTNGSDRAAIAACGIGCAQGAMEFEL